MNTIINNTEEDKNELHQTIFGFPTKNVFASKSLNLIYIIVMFVSIAFAYHALGLILTDWSKGLVFLSSLAVVGLPYCIKIIMYGKDVFTHQIAILCILISLLPAIFDFVGLYSETSIKQQLMNKKFEVLETVNFFDKQARTYINNEILLLNNTTNKKITEEQQLFNIKLKEINDKLNKAEADIEQKSNYKSRILNERINKAQQAVLDETKGVKGKSTSGVAGNGPRSIELEADLRKENAAVELERKESEDNKIKEIEKIKTSIELEIKALEENHLKELDKLKKENENKLNSLKEGIQLIDNLIGDDGLVIKANKSKTLIELAEASIKLNSSINTISSKLKTEPKYIKFESDDVIQLSFGALFRGEITALICFLLAVLLEIVDTIIVYMIRCPKTNKNKDRKHTINNLRSRTHYQF
jgi:hypothetical protein